MSSLTVQDLISQLEKMPSDAMSTIYSCGGFMLHDGEDSFDSYYPDKKKVNCIECNNGSLDEVRPVTEVLSELRKYPSDLPIIFSNEYGCFNPKPIKQVISLDFGDSFIAKTWTKDIERLLSDGGNKLSFEEFRKKASASLPKFPDFVFTCFNEEWYAGYPTNFCDYDILRQKPEKIGNISYYLC